MRPWLLLIIGGLLAGCVQLQPPTDKSDMSWQQFGEQWALKAILLNQKRSYALKCLTSQLVNTKRISKDIKKVRVNTVNKIRLS